MISEGSIDCDDVLGAPSTSPFELCKPGDLKPGTDGTFSSFARRSHRRQQALRQFPTRFLLLRSTPVARHQRPGQLRFQTLHKVHGTERAAAVRTPPDCLALPFELRRRQEFTPPIPRAHPPPRHTSDTP